MNWENDAKSDRRQIILFYIQINEIERKDAMNDSGIGTKALPQRGEHC